MHTSFFDKQAPTSISIHLNAEIGTLMFQLPVAFTVLCFDFKSDYFYSNRKNLPRGYNYEFVTEFKDLLEMLKKDEFQVLLLNYDVDAKIANAICAEVNKKYPKTKVMIGSKDIHPRKAALHAKTKFGASKYYQFPFEKSRLDAEFSSMKEAV